MAADLVYRPEYVLCREVAEYAHFNLCSGLAECLCAVVVAVGSGEYRDIDKRVLDGFALVFELRTRCLAYLAVKAGRNRALVLGLAAVRIDAAIVKSAGFDKLVLADAHSVDAKLSILTVCYSAETDKSRIFNAFARFDYY